MEFERRWHSFSLSELVIVLAVIAVLIGFGLFAFSSSQRTARDQERRLQAGKLVTVIANYFRANSRYPTAASVVWSTNSVSFSGTPVELKGSLKYSSTSTTSSQTRYYYSDNQYGYILCVKLESGDWYFQGGDVSFCPSN